MAGENKGAAVAGEAGTESQEGNDPTFDQQLDVAADEILGGEPLVPQPINVDTNGNQIPESKKRSEEEPPTSADQEGGQPPKTDQQPPADRQPPADQQQQPPAEEDPYAVPEGLSDRGTERFQKLVTIAKEKDAEIAQRDEIIDGFRQLKDQSGLDDSELATVIEIGSQMKRSPQEAYDRLLPVMQDLAAQLGIQFGDADPLEGHDDLKKAVDDMEITPEYAKQLALVRNKEAKQTEIQTAHRQTQEAGQEVTQRYEKGKADVGALIQGLEGSVDWDAIGPHLLEAAQYAAANLEPEKWVGYLENEHQRISKLLAGQEAPPQKGALTTPGGGDGGKAEPRDLDELADQML